MESFAVRATGKLLNTLSGVNARHALYRRDGRWYHHLREFPGVLFDNSGYVLFSSEAEYETSPHLSRGAELHVPGGIGCMPGYVRWSVQSTEKGREWRKPGHQSLD